MTTTADGTTLEAQNKALVAEFMEVFSAGDVDPIRLTPLAWTAEGDRVAVETESYAELVNGRVYHNFYHFVFVVRDGRIEAVKEFLDTEHTRAIFLAP